MAVVTEMMLPVNGIEICAEAFGERGDPAVLLLGGAASSMDWWDAEFCRRLAAGGRYVVRFDYRDTGRSTSFPAGAPPYAVTDLANDALGVLDALRVHRAHLVGLSMGGVLAQWIAVSRPHRVLSLTLMSTTAGPDAPAGSPDAPAGSPDAPAEAADAPAEAPDLSPGSSAGSASVSDLSSDSPTDLPSYPPSSSPADDPGGAAPPSPDWTNRRVAVDRIAETIRALGGAFTPDEPQVRRFAERVFERTADMTACQTNHYMLEAGPPFRARLSEIKAPTLILHGTQDPVFDRSHPETLAAEIPGARLIWLDGVGHEYPPNAVWPTVLAEILAQGAHAQTN